MDRREFVRELQDSFSDFATKRSRIDPNFHSRWRSAGRRAAALAAPLAVLPHGGGLVRDRRTLFVSTRFDGLLASFGPDEAAIIGGPRDRAPAARLGLPFVFNGDLAAAAGALLFGQRWIPAGPVL